MTISIRRPRYFSAILLIIIIIAVNILLYNIFASTSTETGTFPLVWQYLSSGVFKFVTGSLFIPLIFSVIEKRYKFIEGIQKERSAKRKLAEDDKRGQRSQAIVDTLNMWQDLFNLSSEVVFMADEENKSKHLNILIMKFINFTSSAEHVVNKWAFQFPNLTNKDHDLFLVFINTLYQSGLSVAFYLKGTADTEEQKNLKNMLFLIQDQIKSVANQRILNILKNSAQLLDPDYEDLDEEEKKQLESKLKKDINDLRDWSTSINNILESNDNLLAPAKGPQIDNIKEVAKSIEKWLKENNGQWMGNAPDFADFKDQYYNISLEERLSSFVIPYSKEYLAALSNWFSLESTCLYLYNRAFQN